ALPEVLPRFGPLVDSFTTSLPCPPRRDSLGTASRLAPPECPRDLVPGQCDHCRLIESAACSQGSVRSFAPKRAPLEIGSAPARLPMRGRAEHRSVADRAAPTSPLRCSSRTPSQCAKPPSPSSHRPMSCLLC